ncbi:MAG: ATP-binding protein [Candidatus Hydrogenedentes bacterium]|nr:ATP-binding protein [Candidatus Hydrogenedentota bacterium]
MIEISQHILDLLENSINAGASEIYLTIRVDKKQNFLWIVVEDNGPGFPEEVENALTPFFTTKRDKKTGLGLSLAKQAVEQTGGVLNIGRSEILGGAKVEMCFVYSHIDRAPMGDLGSAVAGMVFTCPNISFTVKIFNDDDMLLEINSEKLREKYKDDFEISNLIEKTINEVYESLDFRQP